MSDLTLIERIDYACKCLRDMPCLLGDAKFEIERLRQERDDARALLSAANEHIELVHGMLELQLLDLEQLHAAHEEQAKPNRP